MREPGALVHALVKQFVQPGGIEQVPAILVHLGPTLSAKSSQPPAPLLLDIPLSDANASSLSRHRKICGTTLPRHPCPFCETTFTHGMAVLTVANTSVPNATEPTLTELSKNFSKPHKPNYNVSAQLVTPSL